MIFLTCTLLSFHTPSAINSAIRIPTRRTSTPLLQITDGMSRQQMVAAMEGMKADGSSKLWNTMRLAPRAVSLRELTQSTKLEPKVLDPTATEFEIGDIQDISVKVLIACTVASGLWAVGTDALGNAYYSLCLHAIPRGWARVEVVTSAFHMARTRAAFEWVWGLSPLGALDVRFVSTEDAGIDPSGLRARAEREAQSVAACGSGGGSSGR